MLWLKFTDENGEERRIAMDRDTFTVGRHSACDLTYTDSRLSREHVRIEKVIGGFSVSDLGSSNGTAVNGDRISGSVNLKDGDVIDLGGGLRITAEIEADPQPAAAEPEPDADEANAPAAETAVPAANAAAGVPAASANSGGGVPVAFFIIAPLLGIFVLALVIGAVVLLGGGGDKPTGDRDDIGQTSGIDDDEDSPKPDPEDDDSTPVPVKSSTPVASGTPANAGTTTETPSTTGGSDVNASGNSDETVKIERNGAAFLRLAAQNDQRAFLTGDQAAKVGAKVKQIARASALADNISSARKNASAIKTLAASKNLKPQFLAVAAITKLGGGRGDVMQAAQSVAEVYDKLAIQVSNENADDILLLVAAYDQGAAGDTMKMRNMLQNLAEQPGAPGAREIRTIWYLEKTGKITSAEYDRALSFLAIGTISQNPKDFGVNTEALKL